MINSRNLIYTNILDLTQENPDQRVNQIGNQRLHDCREGSPDDNPNGQVHHVPAGDELFKLF